MPVPGAFAAANPFAKKGLASPSRKRKDRDGLDAIAAGASPLRGGGGGGGGAGLARQSSFAEEARRDKRQRDAGGQ